MDMVWTKGSTGQKGKYPQARNTGRKEKTQQ